LISLFGLLHCVRSATSSFVRQLSDFWPFPGFDSSRNRLFRACIFVDIYKRAMHRSKKMFVSSA
jgi:hypothetical protein